MGPGVARLTVQHPVLVGNVLRVQDTVLCLQGIALREIVADEGGVNRAVHHHMGHMDAARPKLTRHALGQRPQRMAQEAQSFGRMLAEPAAREAFTAFMEKRKPDFSKV